MIRRSFRIGLWLGLLAGIAFAVAKIFRPRPEPSAVLDLGSPGATLAPTRRAWPPLEAAVATPDPVQVPVPDLQPVVASTEPGLVTIGDEPLQEPEPEPESDPESVKKPVGKKSAEPKKAAVKKRAAKKASLGVWVDPDGNICPQSHPVKA
ncbi:MAG TPA: hypothetical protein VGZ52_06430, partial [Acidimicrobiales bacterium]|nr:hypothetical protein [Acidimicrobiales bacterium]